MSDNLFTGLYTWWLAQLSGEKFEFESPHSINTCVDLLEAHSERGKGNGWLKNSKKKLLIRTDMSDENTYSYYVHRDVGRNLIAEVVGTIERHGDITIVRGQGKVGAFTANFALLFITVWVIMVSFLTIGLMVGFGIVGIFAIFILVIPVGVILLLITITNSSREGMTRMLHEVLG